MTEIMNGRQTSPRKRRSFALWILMMGVFCFTLLGWMRLYEAIVFWDWLKILKAEPAPVYFAVSGGLWGGMGMVSLAGLWYKARWAAQFTRLAAAAFVGFYWLDYFLFVRSPGARSGVIFAIGASIAGLGLVFGILQLPRQRRYFCE